APLAHEAMNLGHEDVEVGAPLLLDARSVEEQVHQHGLAASRRAPEVDALGRLRAAEDRGLELAELALQPDEGFHRDGLAGVGSDAAFLQEAPIGGPN